MSTKAQHAPTGRPTTDSRQASRSFPVHTASMMKNWISGGTMTQSA
jgi:hypothetical protein